MTPFEKYYNLLKNLKVKEKYYRMLALGFASDVIKETRFKVFGFDEYINGSGNEEARMKAYRDATNIFIYNSESYAAYCVSQATVKDIAFDNLIGCAVAYIISHSPEKREAAYQKTVKTLTMNSS
jgi:hypothetical protein